MKKIYTNPTALLLVMDEQDAIRTSVQQNELLDLGGNDHTVDWGNLK